MVKFYIKQIAIGLFICLATIFTVSLLGIGVDLLVIAHWFRSSIIGTVEEITRAIFGVLALTWFYKNKTSPPLKTSFLVIFVAGFYTFFEVYFNLRSLNFLQGILHIITHENVLKSLIISLGVFTAILFQFIFHFLSYSLSLHYALLKKWYFVIVIAGFHGLHNLVIYQFIVHLNDIKSIYTNLAVKLVFLAVMFFYFKTLKQLIKH